MMVRVYIKGGKHFEFFKLFFDNFIKENTFIKIRAKNNAKPIKINQEDHLVQ
jgi:hypothetical protein